MDVIFRGVRGSFPVSSPHCWRYGGNTPCIQVDADQTIILIDAGTGIRPIGKILAERRVEEIHLLLSHTHWDHIQGLPHFAPLYEERTRLHVYSLKRPDRPLRDVLLAQQRPPFFPVSLDQTRAALEFTEVEEGEWFVIGDIRILCRRLNHPGLAGGFRLEQDGRVLAYISDTDLHTHLLLGDGMDAAADAERQQWLQRLERGVCDLAHSADLMICDTFFLPDDYKPDWGHSRPDDALRLGLAAQARRVALFHHDPHRSDAQLDEVLAYYQQQAAGKLELLAAAEGLEIGL